MAEVKISQLPQASLPLTGAEIFPLVQSGTTVQAPVGTVSGRTATISTLRALTDVDTYSVIYVEGYYAVGDGGGGYFYSVTSGGPYTDNGGTIIVPTGGDGSKAWLRIVKGQELNGLWFGMGTSQASAVNDAAFAELIAYAGANNFSLYLSEGTYQLSSTFISTNNFYLRGDGSKTVLDFSGFVKPSGDLTFGIKIDGSLTQIENINSATIADQTVTFVSAPTLSVGDVFIIYNPTAGSFNSIRSYYNAGEYCKVTAVSGNTVTLTNPLYASYTDIDVDIYRMTSPKVTVKDIKLKGGDIYGLFQASLCQDVTYQNVTVEHAYYASISNDRCYNVAAINTTLSNIGTLDFGGDCYGMSFDNCQIARIIGGNYYTYWKGIAVGGYDYLCNVPNRDVIIDSASIQNDSATAVSGSDMHGNCENVWYRNCTIYNGVAAGGKNVGYDNCTVYGNTVNGICAQIGEILGGTFTLQNCNFYSAGDPALIGGEFGFVTINGLTADTIEDCTFIVDGCSFELPIASSGSSVVALLNDGATVKTNIVIENMWGLNISAMGNILRTDSVTGTPNADYIIVDNISRFPAGTNLHAAADGDYTNFPHRLQRQAGSFSLTASAATNSAVATSLDFRYPYPRTPVGFVSVRSASNVLFNANVAVVPTFYDLSASAIRPALVSADATNWSATNTFTLMWQTEINEI